MKAFASSRVVVAVLVAAWTVAIALAGCTSSPAPSTAPAGLTIESAFARPAPTGGNGGAFLTVVNPGSTPDRLIAARSPVAPATELHETIDDNGVMKMRPAPGGFEVPAQGRLELQPGSKHIMFVGLTTPLTDGSEVEITLVFEKAGEVTLKVPVRP